MKGNAAMATKAGGPAPRLSDVEAALAHHFDLAVAEEWDNVGLICGDPAQPIRRVLLTIDLTAEVLSEASALRCDLIAAYHPPIFRPISRVVAGDPGGELIFEAIRRKMAVYSLHTVLDVVEGGTSDVLADALGLVERRPLQMRKPAPGRFKLVTFVPASDLAGVSAAVFEAGAGQIGDYSSCSYHLAGKGTFLGGEATSPAIGRRGKLEEVDEYRFETVVDGPSLANVVAALRRAHSYEEPAFDVYPLVDAPPGGIGRIGRLARPASAAAVVRRIKKSLGVEKVLLAGPVDREVRTAACTPGSAGELLDDAIRAGCDLYLTGELRHHAALAAQRAGVTVVCVGHSNSERPALGALAGRFTELLPGLTCHLSKKDADPFVVI